MKHNMSEADETGLQFHFQVVLIKQGQRERGREKLLLVLVVCGERKAEERTERRVSR